jgi:hypothetical protein
MGIDKDGIPFEHSTLHGLPLKRSLAKRQRSSPSDRSTHRRADGLPFAESVCVGVSRCISTGPNAGMSCPCGGSMHLSRHSRIAPVACPAVATATATATASAYATSTVR